MICDTLIRTVAVSLILVLLVEEIKYVYVLLLFECIWLYETLFFNYSFRHNWIEYPFTYFQYDWATNIAYLSHWKDNLDKLGPERSTSHMLLLTSRDYEKLTHDAERRLTTNQQDIDKGANLRVTTPITVSVTSQRQSGDNTAGAMAMATATQHEKQKKFLSLLHHNNILHRSYIEYWSRLLLRYKDKKTKQKQYQNEELSRISKTVPASNDYEDQVYSIETRSSTAFSRNPFHWIEHTKLNFQLQNLEPLTIGYLSLANIAGCFSGFLFNKSFHQLLWRDNKDKADKRMFVTILLGVLLRHALNAIVIGLFCARSNHIGLWMTLSNKQKNDKNSAFFCANGRLLQLIFLKVIFFVSFRFVEENTEKETFKFEPKKQLKKTKQQPKQRQK
ncbi:hypothetical protein RFI_14484 [Reticulomyxa filosa]|uniref:Uncharacterized protein n=1 Tax=Reticulomyxa filosa TaxID=46433 RepID=X6N9X6_RETFI|nr:hypothetical protein RFI_14484 [Reticulomyxa filosa]|eukprot:ETO22713.1 hypothetical protein RFI_14484 [Reticulomyxa filosa]